MLAIAVFEVFLWLALAYIAFKVVFYFLFPKGIKEIKMFRKTKEKYKDKLEK